MPKAHAAFYSTDFSSAGAWTMTGLWGVDGSPSSVNGASPYNSASFSLNYNDGTDFDNGATNSGDAVSPNVVISGAGEPKIRFFCNYQTENTGTYYDRRYVIIQSTNGTTTYATHQMAGSGGSTDTVSCASMGTWHMHEIPLNPDWGNIRVVFQFNTVDSAANAYAGWFVDDVMIGEPVERAPANVSFQSVTADSIQLTWTAANEPASYTVYFGTDPIFKSTMSYASAFPDTTTTYLNLNSGKQYFFKVKVSSHPDYAYSSVISTLTTVANDDFGGAPTASVFPYNASLNTSGLKYNTQILSTACVSEGNRDVWYQITIPSSTVYEINTSSSQYDYSRVVTLWQSTGGTPGQNARAVPLSTGSLACNSDSWSGNKIRIPLTGGNTYFVQVFSMYSNNGGLLNLNVNYYSDNTPPGAVNTLSAYPETTAGSVRLEWTETGDDGATGSFTDGGAYDIRYSLTGKINNDVDFSSAIPITSSPTWSWMPSPYSPSTLKQHWLSSLPQWTMVYFAIKIRDEVAGNWSGISNSTGVLVPRTLPPATNTAPSSAISIPSLPYAEETNTMNLGSPSTSLIPYCAQASNPGNYVWYTYLATTPTQMIINTFGSNYNTVLAVYTLSLGGSNENEGHFSSYSCNDDDSNSTQSKLTVWPTIGTTYYIQASGLWNTGGTLKLSVSPPESIPPGKITGLTASPGSNPGDLNLSWVSPANNGYDSGSGNASWYQLKFSTYNNITQTNWESSATVKDSWMLNAYPPQPMVPGTLQTMTLQNLTPGGTYWFAIKAYDDAGNTSQVSNCPKTFAKPFPQGSGDGEGSATISPLTVPVSEVVTVTITFTLGGSSYTAGGGIELTLPENWGSPQTQNPTMGCSNCSVNYATCAVTKGNAELTLYTEMPAWPERPRIVVNIASGSFLNGGDRIAVYYQHVWSQWQKQDGVQWKIRSRGSGSSNSNTYKEITSHPTFNVVSGTAKNIGFPSWNTITMGKGQVSPPLTLVPLDGSWNQTSQPASTVATRVYLLRQRTTDYSWEFDPEAAISFSNTSFSTSAFMISTISWMNNSEGRMGPAFNVNLDTPSFYYRTSSTGTTAMMVEYFKTGGWGGPLGNWGEVDVTTNSNWRNFNIKEAVLDLSGLDIQPATITPDGDASSDFATIKFKVSIPDAEWIIKVSSDPFVKDPLYNGSISSITTLMDWWGQGDPSNYTPSWYGMGNNGQVVPNGTYHVRVQDKENVSYQTGSITVNASSIGGTVTKGGQPVPNVWVNANGGSETGGYVWRGAQTDANGAYTIRGLKSGVAYRVTANFYSTSTYKNYYKEEPFTASNQSDANIVFTEPSQIMVRVTLSEAPAYDQYGWINVFDANGQGQAWGSFRVRAGETVSDPGWQVDVSTTYSVLTMNQTGTYTVRAEMPSYDKVDSPAVTISAAGDVKVVNLSMAKKPTIFGSIVIPSTAVPIYGTWINVEGIKQGQTNPTIWGGAWVNGSQYFQNSMTTASFSLVGASPDSQYTIRARAQGIGSTQTVVTMGSSDYGTYCYGCTEDQRVSSGVFLVFGSASPGITGTIQVMGNTGSLPSYSMQGSSFTLWVNAWSPTNYAYESTQVQLATKPAVSAATYSLRGVPDGMYNLYTWLDGYEFDPPGNQMVEVTNGAATKDLTLKQFQGRLNVYFKNLPSAAEYANCSLAVKNDWTWSSVLNSSNIVTNLNSSNADIKVFASSAVVRMTNLGSGFYSVEGGNMVSGKSRSSKVSVKNDAAVAPAEITFDFGGSTYSITGKVTVQSFTMRQGTFSVTVTSAPGLMAATSFYTDTFWLGGSNISKPVSRIDAYAKNSGDFDDKMMNMVGIAGTAGVSTGDSTQFGYNKVKSGAVDVNGNYQIDGLEPGVYLLRHPIDLDPINYNGPEIANEEKVVLIKGDGVPQILSPAQGDLNFTYQDGTTINGSVKLPSDVLSETIGLSLVVKNERQEIVNWKWLQFNNNSQASFSIEKLASGNYTLEILPVTSWDNMMMRSIRKYVAKPLSFSLPEAEPKSKDIQLLKPGSIKGKIATEKWAIPSGSTIPVKSYEPITANNRDVLPSNGKVYAKANPWVEGGWCEADMEYGSFNGSKIKIDDNGYFWITGLLPDYDYDVQFKQDSYDASSLGKGSLNFIPISKSGIRVGANQIYDLGTLQLSQGLTVNGSIRDAGGTPLANIKVKATPSGMSGDEGYNNTVQAYSNAQGSFTLSGLSNDLRFYDITAAPRDSDKGESAMFDAASQLQNAFAATTKPNWDVRKTTWTADFAMNLASGSITGYVVTSDGKPLSMPWSDAKGFPAAAIIANKVGDIPRNNPLGEIELMTDTNGKFTISRLEVGKAYKIHAICAGYSMGVMDNVLASPTEVSVGTITVTNGASISGTIVKPDGSKPSDSEADMIIASNEDFTNIAFGQFKTNSGTHIIEEYSVSGLSTGTAYSLLIFLKSGNDFLVPPEGASINLSTPVANYKLTFAYSAPTVQMRVKKAGTATRDGSTVDTFEFTLELTQALRNKTMNEQDDNYWQTAVSVKPLGNASDANDDLTTYASGSIDPGRKKIILTYTPKPTAKKIRVRLNAPTNVLQPGTSYYFTADTTFEFYVGLAGQKSAKFSALSGGVIKLDDDATQAEIPAGAFMVAGSTWQSLSVSSSVSVGLQKAQDVATATSSASGAPVFLDYDEQLSKLPPAMASAVKVLHELRMPPTERPKGVYGAPRGAAQSAEQVASNVFGAFYDIFLPAGVNRTLKKNAKVTLSYNLGSSTQSVSTDTLNVYFYNDSNSNMYNTNGSTVPPGGYGLETASRTINTDNQTISVYTNHFTVYVVVNATTAVLGAAAAGGASAANLNTLAYTGTEILAFNFPNPFNPNDAAQSQTLSKIASGGTNSLASKGTLIRYALPANLGGNAVHVSLEIFDVAGDLVKRLDFGSQTTGRYYYDSWDGKNEDGQTVASGVYIGRLAIDGTDRSKIFKMAVIK